MEVDALARLYVEATFSGRSSAASEAAAEQAWRGLRGPLGRALLRRAGRWEMGDGSWGG